MKFTRLRLSGFKSFIEPTEMHIEPGLTGIVGPNGCGKSNLLEALRWVMGESSYKSMRASGMDDVIFSGTASRPARNMAEVVVTMDNADRTGPPSCSESDIVEISRRIEREAGSAYRVNGKDVRARDVQLLFADASTGARSPSLVRQGQIGEIINSKPQARRRILEEAAGITGLHTRRHEAELKLNAAETNLIRLEDVVGQLESQLQSLKRQARQAVRYKQLSADIRRMEAAGLYSAWKDAVESLSAEKSRIDEITRLLGGFTKAVSEFTRAHDEINECLPKLREHEATRSAVVQRLTLEREGLEKEEAQASQRGEELNARLEQIQTDLKREQDILSDTDEAVARLGSEEEALKAASDDADQRAVAAKTLQACADKLAQSQEDADAANAALSALSAKRNALTNIIDEQSHKLTRLEQEVAAVDQQHRTIADKTGDRDNAGQLSQFVEQAVQAATAAERSAHDAEALVRDLRQSETTARQAFDEARRMSDNIATEVRTLTKLLEVADSDLWTPLVDAVKVDNGYEAALGAALGDEIDAPSDEAAPIHWKTLPPIADWAGLPDGVQPLSRFVKAPSALARSLDHIGVVERKDGARLQRLLKSGQRLVSVKGDLWRWDGYSATADAPTAATQRLAGRNRLGELQSENAAAQRATDETRQKLDQVRINLEAAVETEKDKRDAWRAAMAAVETAQRNLSNHERELSEQLQQASALKEATRRLQDSIEETRTARKTAETQLRELPAADGLEERLATAREAVGQDSSTYSEARATFVGLEREARLKTGRLEAIENERRQWRDRSERAKGQIEALDARTSAVCSELEGLADLPQQFEERRKKLMNLVGEAESECREAKDALANEENQARAAAGRLREAQDQLNQSREEHARLEARVEGAQERRREIEQRISEILQCAPDKIVETAGLDADKIPPKDEIDRRLYEMRDQRERLGGVNLRAEEEAEEVSTQLAELITERDDLIQAINKLRSGIYSLNKEGRQRLLDAFGRVNDSFASLFTQLFNGGRAELQLIESDDPLEAGLEIVANPPGKRPQVLSLLSGGEQALTALALIFAVFLTNPSPICVLDEVDAPLDDHNVERFCNLLDAMLERTNTRFLIITHHALTMARMHRLFGVTMMERGVSQLVSVDLETAEGLREAS